MNSRIKAHMSILGANLLFGLNYSIAKGVMPDYIKPGGFTLLRVSTALILYYSLASIKIKEKISSKDYPRFIAAGLLGVAINQLLFLNGLSFTSPIDAAIITTLNPAFVMVIAALAIGERITSVRLFGLLVGASGALLIILNRGIVELSMDHLNGNLMILANTLSYAGYLVVVKPLMAKYSPITVMKGVFLVGFFAVLPFGYSDLMATSWRSIPGPIWASIIFVLIGPTFLAYLLNSWGLKFVRATTVSIYIYSQPVIAAFVAAIIGQDSLDLLKVTAAFLVFLGVYFVSKPSLVPGKATNM